MLLKSSILTEKIKASPFLLRVKSKILKKGLFFFEKITILFSLPKRCLLKLKILTEEIKAC